MCTKTIFRNTLDTGTIKLGKHILAGLKNFRENMLKISKYQPIVLESVSCH